MEYQGFFEILMITLISSKKLGVYKIMRNTVITKLTQQENLKMSFYKLKQAGSCQNATFLEVKVV